MAEPTLFATLRSQPPPGGEVLARLRKQARGLQVRADLMAPLTPALPQGMWPGPSLYTLRSVAEGGAFSGAPREREALLIAAARSFELVELEAERDLSPAVLARIPPAQRVISWSGEAEVLEALRERFRRMARVEARYYVLAPSASEVLEALAPLRLLRELGREDVIAFARGRSGAWSRVLSAWLGAPLLFGDVGEAAEGGLTLEQLVHDYGLPARPPVRELFGIVGAAVSRSLSPRLHNAAYRALDLRALYLPFPTHDFSRAWLEELLAGLDELGLPLRGLTVSSPFKESALEVADSVSPLVRRSRAANALLWREGGWRAETTDAEGVVDPLLSRGISVQGQRVAVIGCGGAGRAAAAGLQQAGAQVTLVNRGGTRGQLASSLLELPFVPLSDFTAREFVLVVNATPCAGYQDEYPFSVEELEDSAAVLDFVYGAMPTPLVTATLARGLRAIDGREVLLAEVRHQFQFMTGHQLPAALAQAALLVEETA